MVLRTYFDRNNTIVKDRNINTGKNPVTELYYGLDENGNQIYSRFLCHFNLDTISKHFDSNDTGNLTHTLKMTNTGAFHNELLNKSTSDGKKRTSSFELVIYEIPEDWVEGTGYDYHESNDATISEQPSNWYFAKTNGLWGIKGAAGSVPTPVGSQVFSDGDENLEIDITDLVNGYINGQPNNGLLIAYKADLEITEAEELQYVGFFTRHTQTFYQPYIETKMKNPIKDDRNEFYMGKDNKLYLYVHQNGTPSDIEDGTVAVNIKNNIDEVYGTRLTATRERKGVYSVTLNIPQDDTLTNQIFFDYWVAVTLDVDSNEVETPIADMQFELKDNSKYFQAGYEDIVPKQYKMNIMGINQNDRIKSGDIRKIYVNAVIPYTVNHMEVLDKIEYRLYVKEGFQEHTVIDYQPVERTFQNNYFLLDTSSLLPTVYHLDIKFYSNLEARTTKEVIKFEIIK
jgi:hypothetical protein